MASRVGPAVTRTEIPFMSLVCEMACSTASRRTEGSDILPEPVAPQASRPLSGPMISQPYPRRSSRLCCVTGFSYIFVFIAGAISFGAFEARTVVVSMSSANPAASFAMMLAVAGAMMTASALSASEMCSISQACWRSKVSVTVRLCVSASKVRGCTNRVACSVIITFTSACCFTSAEASSHAL